MGLVLDFGGSKEAVYTAFRRVAAPHDFKVLVLPIAQEEDLTYSEFQGRLDEALACISDARCSSVQVEGRGASRFLAGLYRPHFTGHPLAEWSASAEGLGATAEASFEELQSIEGLSYVALFREESADFHAAHINEETFPWSDWRLIAGAVRATDGKWIIRRRSR